MVLETVLDSNNQLAIPLMLPVSGSRGIMEALSLHSSLKNEEHLNYVHGMAQLNPNLVSYVKNSTIAGESSTSSPVSFPSENSMTDLSTADAFAHLCRDGQKNRERKQVDEAKASTDVPNTKLQTLRNSLPVTPVLKKPRLDVHQETFQHELQQQLIIQELLLNELQYQNAQLKATIKHHRQHNQLHPPMRSLLDDQDSQPRTFAPLLDSGICSRRVMQYLYHLRNLAHENGIAYWRNFVSEYYAPGARKRWCFSNYGDIHQHTTGVFCPKAMATWCCDICCSKSGKGLEASFEVIPRLLEIKFTSGMLDEILFLESPRACKIQSGLMLEYQKAVQESVYENSRVVHEGKLRIVFRHDLKILSWEFCALNHEEFLLRRLVVPQVNQLVQAAERYQNGNQNGASISVSSEDLQRKCKDFVSAENQLARTMETPLVNDLGYPKRFIRCLQISEVANSLKDLMDLSRDRKMGPIESLNNFFQRTKSGNQMKEKQERELFAHTSPRFRTNAIQMTENGTTSVSRKRGLTLVNSDRQHIGQNSSTPSEKSKNYEHGKSPHQALVGKLLHDMAAANRGRSMKDTYGKSKDETLRQPYQNAFTSLLKGPMQKRATSNEVYSGESSNAASRTANLASNGNSSAVGHNISIKEEPHSPECPEYLQNLPGLSGIGDLEW